MCFLNHPAAPTSPNANGGGTGPTASPHGCRSNLYPVPLGADRLKLVHADGCNGGSSVMHPERLHAFPNGDNP